MLFPLWYWLQGLSCSRYWARYLDHCISQSTCMKLVRWDMNPVIHLSLPIFILWTSASVMSYVILSNKILSVLPKTIWDSMNWMPCFSPSHTPRKYSFKFEEYPVIVTSFKSKPCVLASSQISPLQLYNLTIFTVFYGVGTEDSNKMMVSGTKL